jgi:hypothetical protein
MSKALFITLHNYFDDPTKLFLDICLAKFSDTLARKRNVLSIRKTKWVKYFRAVMYKIYNIKEKKK